MSSDLARSEVFFSYSHTDAAWLKRLKKLLKPFQNQGRLRVWADADIQAGALWQPEIDAALARARVGVVLLTPDLLASDFVADVELPALLRAAKAGTLTLLVVPIEAHAAGSTRFADGDLMDFQWAWDSSRPLAELPLEERTRGLVKVTEIIVNAVGPSSSRGGDIASPLRVECAPPGQGSRVGALHGVPKLPPNYLQWAVRHDNLKQALLGSSVVVGVTAGRGTLGLQAQGGVGKTVTAQGLALDEQVRRSFPDGIYWITVGQSPRLESLQASLMAWLGDHAAIEDLETGTRLLRERVRGKSCLLVLDDVWQIAHARAFDIFTEGASRLLVTTRDRSILTALGAWEMALEQLPPTLALELLARWAGVPATQLPAAASEIAKEVDHVPLALALAGAQIHDGRSWLDVLTALRHGDLVYLDHPYGSVFKSLHASVTALDPVDARRYIELAVFPEDVNIPVAVIEQLWRATSGDDVLRLRARLARLASRNLLRLEVIHVEPSLDLSSPGAPGDDEQVVMLHDLQHDFVGLLVEGLSELHGRLVDAWHAELPPRPDADVHESDRWATLPAESEYAWQFLAHHLRQAARDVDLEGLLTSPDWIFARVARFSVPAVLADYQQAKRDPGLRSVRDALVLSTHVLSQDPTALTGQLAGRLLNSPDPRIQALIARAPMALGRRPWLRPLVACLTPPGGALLQTFEGHRSAVTAVTILPDARRALSGSTDGSLTLWDLVTGTVLETFEEHRDTVTAVTVLPDGRRALSASDDETLKLWDLTAGTVLRTFAEPDGVPALMVLPDGQRALVGTYEWTLKLWDLTAGTVLRTFEGHDNHVTAVELLPDGQRALSGSADGTLKLWDLTTGTKLRTFEGHSDGLTAVTVLPDGQRALTGSADGTLKLWELTAAPLIAPFHGHKYGVTAVTVLPDGQRALSGGGDGVLKLWDLTAGTVLGSWKHHSIEIIALAVLPDGHRALSASVDEVLKLWDLTAGTVLQTFDGRSLGVTALTGLPDGQRALSGCPRGTLRLWDLTSGTVLQTFEGHRGAVTGLTVLPDGHRALSTGADETLRLWDLTSGAMLQTFQGHHGSVTAVSVLPDGHRALSGSADETLKLWSLTAGTVLQTFEGHRGWVTGVSVLPDGHRAISASADRTLKLWDLESRKVLCTFYDEAPLRCLSLTDDLRVVTGNELGRVCILKLE